MARTKVLFIAMDAGDAELLEAWMDAGHLPHLSRFRESAAHGIASTPRGFGSDAIWPSVFTGVDPSKHARYYHTQEEAGTYGETSRRLEVRREPVWAQVGRANRRVAALDLPKAPLTPDFDGIQIADWRTHTSSAGETRSWPAGLAHEVIEDLGGHVLCPCWATRYEKHDYAREEGWLKDLRKSVRDSAALSERFLAQENWDLFMTAFSASHCAGHQLWHVHDSTHPRHRPEVGAREDPIRVIYQEIDEAFGRLLALAGRDAAVMFFAGPGLGPNYVQRDLADEIVARLDRGAARSRHDTVRALKSAWRQIPDRWRTRLASSAHLVNRSLTAKDRAQRDYYAVTTNDTIGGVRINLAGREPHGMVAPSDYASVCNFLVREISAITIVDSGRPLALDVFRTTDVYSGENVDRLPDVMIEWNHEGPISAVTSPAVGVIAQTRPPDWSGTHRAGGLLLTRVPGGESQRLGRSLSVLDVAPTLAALVGVELADVDGRSVLPVPVLAPAFA